MTTTKKSAGLSRLITLFFLFIVGMCFAMPCFGIFWGMGMTMLERSGALSRWESLGAPPETPTEILGASSIDLVYVATKEGRIYGCDPLGRQFKCWSPVSQPPKAPATATPNKQVFEGKVPPPPGTIARELLVVYLGGEFFIETHYVILTDGTVWKWKYSWFGITLFTNILDGLIAGVRISMLLAILIVLVGSIVSIARRLRANKTHSGQTS